MVSMTRSTTSRYMPGLDGLRALAVIAVIAYHLNLSFAPGGLLGVDVFFVLSGYLITDILIGRWREDGRLNLADFWMRRARRLLPALFTMLGVVVVFLLVLNSARLATLWGDLAATLLYVSNWWLIFHRISYFLRFGPPSPLGHLWSLAVEEQFYVVWPLLLALGLRRVQQKWALAGLILAAAAASAADMALLYHPGMDPSRVYYGTDTRAFSLLIGAALAVLWPSPGLAPALVPGRRLAIDLAGGLALGLVLWMIVRTNEYEGFLYRGGLAGFSLAAAMVVAALAHPASRLGRAFGWRPLRWIGARSYGIYLWHYPVIALTTPSVDTGGVSVLRDALQVAASIILADLSWRWIEEPVRRGRLRLPVPGKKRERSGAGRVHMRLTAAALALAALVTVPPSLFGHSSAATTDRVSLSGRGSAPGGARATGTRETTSASARSHTATKKQPTGRTVAAIGDSIMIDAAPFLQKLLPGIVVDGSVGRQMYELPNVLAQLKKTHELRTDLIIELGTNGPFDEDQVVSELRALGPMHRIVLVNTRVPRPWEGVVNSDLAQVAAAVPHAVMANWYTASAGHNEWFYPDGVHLDPQGAAHFAALLVAAVETPSARRHAQRTRTMRSQDRCPYTRSLRDRGYLAPAGGAPVWPNAYTLFDRLPYSKLRCKSSLRRLSSAAPRA